MCEDKMQKENNTNSINENPNQIETNINLAETRKEKKEPIFQIPIAQINIKYYQITLKKRKRNGNNSNTKTKKENNNQLSLNINLNNLILPNFAKNNPHYNQNSINNINLNMNNIQSKMYNPGEEKDKKGFNNICNQPNEEKNKSSINENPYNNEITSDLLSTGTSINEENNNQKFEKDCSQKNNNFCSNNTYMNNYNLMFNTQNMINQPIGPNMMNMPYFNMNNIKNYMGYNNNLNNNCFNQTNNINFNPLNIPMQNLNLTGNKIMNYRFNPNLMNQMPNQYNMNNFCNMNNMYNLNNNYMNNMNMYNNNMNMNNKKNNSQINNKNMDIKNNLGLLALLKEIEPLQKNEEICITQKIRDGDKVREVKITSTYLKNDN